MSDLRRIVPPGKGPDRWLRASVAIVSVFVFLALAKPWGSGAAPRAAFPIETPHATAVPTVHALTRGAYDPALFGQEVPDPGWQLWPAGYVVDFGLAGPVTIDPPTAAATGAPPEPSATPRPSRISPFGPSEPIRLGGADNLVVLGVNNPDDVHVDAIRLWRFDGRLTHRVPVSSLRSPWPTPHFHVIGMPSNNSTDGLGPWVPGLYRLDLLTSPTDAIRSVVLVIDPPSGAAPSAVAPSSAPVAIDTITPIAGSLVLFEPNGASVEQQAASSAEGDTSCSLAKLWRGETAAPGTTCAAIPAAGLAAIGVGLQIRAGSPSKEPASISLQQLDPVRRDVPVVTRALLQGAVVVRADGHPLDDGFYELKATTFAGETLHWYLDVIGPPS